MKKLLLLLLALSSQLSALSFAEPITLTNRQLDELTGAAQKIGPGLTGANAMKLTRDLLALRPHAEAYGAGIKAELTNRKITPATKTDSPEWAGYLAAVEKLAAEAVKIDLQLFRISEEEFDRLAPTTPPAVLEIVIRHLEPKK